MEFLTKARAFKLRSHNDKYLTVGEDHHHHHPTIKLSRNCNNSRKSIWVMEKHETKHNLIRIKNLHTGYYLTASDVPFLLGMTGKKIVLTIPDSSTTDDDWNLHWEPIRDGFQVKLKSWCGKYLRGNGGTPPWRNSVTHDEPHAGPTQNWVLWDVVGVELDKNDAVLDYLSSFSSVVSDEVMEVLSDEVYSPVKSSSRFSFFAAKSSSFNSPKKTYKQESGMDFFHKAKTIRLRSHHDKYLTAEEDQESVTQDRNGTSKNSKWIVEHVPGSDSLIRLKSCYNNYLTATDQPHLLGIGKRTTLTLPRRLDSSVEWEPIREGNLVKLKTRYGNFLRANGGLPPWRNSITHDVPNRSATQEWILWDACVVEINQVKPSDNHVIEHQDSSSFDSNSTTTASIGSNSAKIFSQELSNDSCANSPRKSEGRMIYYHVADESGDVDDVSIEPYSFQFKGNGVDELTQKLREESGIENILVCSRSPLNQKLYPLRLQLPPNSADMHLVVVPSSSKSAKECPTMGIL
ncbi:hypothetical protein ACFE04_024759 [Oxalis oulophora]